MSIPVSASYVTAESATIRAEMNFYLTFRKTTLSPGTPGATENISISGDTFSLAAEATRGSWTSASINTTHPSKDSTFRLFWDREAPLAGGEETVYLRSATVASELGDTAWSAASIFSNSVLSHYRYKKWCQIKLKITRDPGEAPQVSTITIESRAVVPNSEIISYPETQVSIGKDFLGVIGSKMRVGLNNKDRLWDELYADGYVFNRLRYLDDQYDLYAGLKIDTGDTEYLPLFSGKPETFNLDSQARLANLTVRGLLIDRLANAVVGGKNISTGLPEPYIAGRRYRDHLIEIDGPGATRVWEFLSKSVPATINNVYTRGVGNNLWRVFPTASYTASEGDRTVTFESDATVDGDVAIDVLVDSTKHPVDHIKDILDNEVSIKYSNTQLERLKSVYPDFEIGVHYEDESGFEAISRLARLLDAAVYESGDKLSFVSIQTMLPSTHNLARRDYRTLSIDHSKLKVVNKYSVPYGDYWDDRAKVVSSSDTNSIASYGIRDLAVIYGGEYTYTYADPISVNDSGPITNLVTKLKLRLPQQKDTFRLEDVYSKPLRVELGDKAVINNPFFGFTDKLIAVHEKNLSLKSRDADLSAMGYTIYEQFTFAPLASSPLASNWVSTPIPSSRVAEVAYFF